MKVLVVILSLAVLTFAVPFGVYSAEQAQQSAPSQAPAAPAQAPAAAQPGSHEPSAAPEKELSTSSASKGSAPAQKEQAPAAAPASSPKSK